MNAEASPRPWTFCPTYGEHRPNSIIVDADGGNVALVCYFANEEEENRIGNLIVDAVNERERLRDIVRRLLPLAETTVENIRALGAARFPFEEQIKSDRLRGDINREVANADHLLRKARAAIGARNAVKDGKESKKEENK